MDSSVAKRATTNSTRLCRLSAMGSSSIKITARTVPASMNGVRFPSGVSTLSESVPNTGSRKSARTLSIAISTPVTVSPSPKVFCRISGIMLSYIFQKAQILKNASPTKKVLL